jgi:hypothetical protein
MHILLLYTKIVINLIKSIKNMVFLLPIAMLAGLSGAESCRPGPPDSLFLPLNFEGDAIEYTAYLHW